LHSIHIFYKSQAAIQPGREIMTLTKLLHGSSTRFA